MLFQSGQPFDVNKTKEAEIEDDVKKRKRKNVGNVKSLFAFGKKKLNE